MRKELQDKIKKLFPELDLTNADFTTELAKYIDSKTIIQPGLPNLFAKPINLDEFIGDQMRWVSGNLHDAGARLDAEFQELIQSSNSLSIKLSETSSNLADAAEAVYDLQFAKSNEGTDFVWVTDSFNTNVFTAESSAFIDTVNGEVTLQPIEYDSLSNFSVSINYEGLKAQQALPGANLLAVETRFRNDGVDVLFDPTPSKALSSLFDKDSTTWFEVERNFIYPKQKLGQRGKAWVTDGAGSLADVVEKTSNLDWQADVIWPGNTAVTQPIAVFKDVIGLNANIVSSNPEEDFGTTLDMIVTFTQATSVTSLNIIPLVRAQYPSLILKSLRVEVEGLTDQFTLIENMFITKQKTSTDNLSIVPPKSPSEQLEGVRLPIPVESKITKMYLTFYGGVVKDVFFAHPFSWVNIHRRSERNYGFFSSVDHEDIPKRLPVYEKPPIIEATTNPSTTFGSTYLNPVNTTPANGTVVEAENKPGPVQFLQPIANIASQQSNVTPQITGGFSSLIPANILQNVAGAVLGNLLNIGGFNRDFTVTDQANGFDLFLGARSCIAMRELKFEKVKFNESVEWVSEVRQFTTAVKSIGLFVETEIPIGWDDGTWIEYWIDVGNTSNWQPIQPLVGKDLDQSFQLDQPITKFRLKATIKGNSSDPYQTPRLRHYAVKGFPA